MGWKTTRLSEAKLVLRRSLALIHSSRWVVFVIIRSVLGKPAKQYPTMSMEPVSLPFLVPRISVIISWAGVLTEKTEEPVCNTRRPHLLQPINSTFRKHFVLAPPIQPVFAAQLRRFGWRSCDDLNTTLNRSINNSKGD